MEGDGCSSHDDGKLEVEYEQIMDGVQESTLMKLCANGENAGHEESSLGGLTTVEGKRQTKLFE